MEDGCDLLFPGRAGGRGQGARSDGMMSSIEAGSEALRWWHRASWGFRSNVFTGSLCHTSQQGSSMRVILDKKNEELGVLVG